MLGALLCCRLQSCMKPATDIFISSQQMVASIVALPLMYGDQNLGGLYFTLETPSNFQNIKDMLMGFVNSIVLVLLQKLEGQLHQMWDVVVTVSGPGGRLCGSRTFCWLAYWQQPFSAIGWYMRSGLLLYCSRWAVLEMYPVPQRVLYSGPQWVLWRPRGRMPPA